MRDRILIIRQASAALLAGIACAAILASCGGRAYVHDAPDFTELRGRAETQTDGPIRVSAAVPGREETSRIFGVDLYDQGIQPVWLEVENSGTAQVRYAMVSTDRYYFSPFEVAYKNRSGFSDEARAEMERYFNKLNMPRYVDPGETRSGLVFTHADTGAKGFNVDIFSGSDSYYFNFLLRVPGFVPDYANVDFDSIYSESEITVYNGDELRDALKQLPCCSSDGSGDKKGGAINVVLIGAGRDLLIALLRSAWIETSAAESDDRDQSFLFGRKQDAIFRYESFADDSSYELSLWLAPMLAGSDRVWAGQVRHFYTTGRAFNRIDPDVDNARNVAFQHLLYGQAVEQMSWIAGEEVVPVESFWENLIRPSYFSGGHRLVLWLSDDPISLTEVISLDWDQPPGID
ncbi:MAG: hypothetical protein ACR2QX_06320 [Woeseiaceae bacterium]